MGSKTNNLTILCIISPFIMRNKKCIECGKINLRPRSKFCSKKCDKKFKYKERVSQNLCVKCGNNLDRDGVYCSNCAKKQNDNYNLYSEKGAVYRKNRRKIAAQDGYCQTCCIREKIKGLSVCYTCRNRKIEKYKKHCGERQYIIKAMFRNAQRRAKKQNIPFDINIDDIIMPDVCPILGIPLIKGTNKLIPNSPSLDRIIPEKGYVKGNVCVISHKANTIKSYLTKELLLNILKYIEQFEK